MIKSACTLTKSERRILARLRGAAAGADGAERGHSAADAISALMQVLPPRTMLPVAAPYVSADERQVMGALTIWQQLPAEARRQAVGIALIFAGAADQLERESLKLSATSGFGHPVDGSWLPAQAGPLRLAMDQQPVPGTVKAKILDFVREHGEVSREAIMQFGISRQYLSLLVKGGALTKVRPGRYRVAGT